VIVGNNIDGVTRHDHHHRAGNGKGDLPLALALGVIRSPWC
jgi:hypothetical protein